MSTLSLSDETMVVEKDVAVPMRDGATLRANVFRPVGEGRWPVILCLSPYGKDVHFSEFVPPVWERLQRQHPAITAGSSLRHLVFEAPDPEVWTRHGYAVVRVDSRGSGKSPGFLRPNSPEEFVDAYDAVEWAGEAPWSNGRVGMLGISYYAAGQWMIGQQRPPHLAALQPWQGTSDFYRDRTRKGGILSNGFVEMWWDLVLENQHGNGNSRFTDYFTGERNTGPSLEPAELASRRVEYVADLLNHPLEDEWYAARSADLSRISVPTLVGANWGGLQVHLRGTLLGYTGIASTEKWLRIQRGSYFLSFYEPENVEMQRRFFDRYLKNDEAAWLDEPRVEVAIRSSRDGVRRTITGSDWPLPGTTPQVFHLDCAEGTLSPTAPLRSAARGYSAVSSGLSFETAPLPGDLEFAGPILLEVRVSSSTSDADVFATLQAFRPDGSEITFDAVGDPHSPVSLGWLRASHRRVDRERSGFLRPFHAHDTHCPLEPGVPYDLEIELWPASLCLEADSRLRLTLTGSDFDRGHGLGDTTHDHPTDRLAEVYHGAHTIHTGPGVNARLTLPSTKEVR